MAQNQEKALKMYRGYNIVPNDNIRSDNDPRVFFIVYLFSCNSCDAEWESAVEGLEGGDNCGNPEHLNVIGNQLTNRGLTPIQKEGVRFFGHFKCHRCARNWSSAHSWANTSQKCQTCLIQIYPHDMRPLYRGSGGGDSKRKHESSLCHKCIQLGNNCSKVASKSGGRRVRARQRGRRRGSRQNQAPADIVAKMNALQI